MGLILTNLNFGVQMDTIFPSNVRYRVQDTEDLSMEIVTGYDIIRAVELGIGILNFDVKKSCIRSLFWDTNIIDFENNEACIYFKDYILYIYAYGKYFIVPIMYTGGVSIRIDKDEGSFTMMNLPIKWDGLSRVVKFDMTFEFECGYKEVSIVHGSLMKRFGGTDCNKVAFMRMVSML